MPRNYCQVCNHPEVDKINEMLVQGKSITAIQRRFGFSCRDMLYRHKDRCISKTLVASLQQKQGKISARLMEKIDATISRAERIFRRNYRAKKDVIALKALGEIRSTIDLLQRISFQYHQAMLMEMQVKKNNDPRLYRMKEEKVLECLSDEELEQYHKILKKLHTARCEIYDIKPEDVEVVE